MEAEADLERVLVIDDRDTPLTLADERIARAIRENNARLVIIDPVQAFLGADVDMNRANEVRPIFRSLGDIAQATGCAIVLIGHLNKAAGTQSTYRGLGSVSYTHLDVYKRQKYNRLNNGKDKPMCGIVGFTGNRQAAPILSLIHI